MSEGFKGQTEKPVKEDMPLGIKHASVAMSELIFAVSECWRLKNDLNYEYYLPHQESFKQMMQKYFELLILTSDVVQQTPKDYDIRTLKGDEVLLHITAYIQRLKAANFYPAAGLKEVTL